MWKLVKYSNLNNGILVKWNGDVQYQIIYREPLDKELDGFWEGFRIEGSHTALQIFGGRLEQCIRECNKDAKQ
jgi:hypothetical protein